MQFSPLSIFIMENVFDKNKEIEHFWNVEKYVIYMLFKFVSFIWIDLGWPCKVKLNTVRLPVLIIKGSVVLHSL